MAEQSSDTDDTSMIFWPGYVDAISNLVLNLLFLVMILCLAIFVMSQLPQQPSSIHPGAPSRIPQEIQSEEARPERGLKLSTGGKTDVVQKRADIEVRPSPQGQLPGAVEIKSQTVSDQGVYLEVHYLADALELNEAAQQALREHLQPLLKQGFTQWDVVVVTDTAFASMRRSALLRILRVREALQAPELSELKSQTRIESGGTPATSAVVRLVGRRPQAAQNPGQLPDQMPLPSPSPSPSPGAPRPQ